MGWDSQETIAISRLQNCFELLTHLGVMGGGGGGGWGGDKKGIIHTFIFFFRSFVYSWPILLSVCFIKKKLISNGGLFLTLSFVWKLSSCCPEDMIEGVALIASFLSFMTYRHTYKINDFISRVNQKVMYISLSLSLSLCAWCDCVGIHILWLCTKIDHLVEAFADADISNKNIDTIQNIAIISIGLFVSICISNHHTVSSGRQPSCWCLTIRVEHSHLSVWSSGNLWFQKMKKTVVITDAKLLLQTAWYNLMYTLLIRTVTAKTVFAKLCKACLCILTGDFVLYSIEVKS